MGLKSTLQLVLLLVPLWPLHGVRLQAEEETVEVRAALDGRGRAGGSLMTVVVRVKARIMVASPAAASAAGASAADSDTVEVSAVVASNAAASAIVACGGRRVPLQ